MNLTRMRQFEFDQLALQTYDQYKDTEFRDGVQDQDIINIIFGTHRGNHL